MVVSTQKKLVRFQAHLNVGIYSLAEHGAGPILVLSFAGLTGVNGDREVDCYNLKTSKKLILAFILLYSWHGSKYTMGYFIQSFKQLVAC